MPRISKVATDKWLALVSEFRAKNLPLHKFANERNVSPHSLNYGLKKTRRDELVPPNFARLRVLPAESDCVLVHLPKGSRVEVRGELARQLLGHIMSNR